MRPRNTILADIVLSYGGTVTDQHNRNALLLDILILVGADSELGLTSNELLERILSLAAPITTPNPLLLRYDETSIQGTTQAVTGWNDLTVPNDNEFNLSTSGTGAEPTIEQVNGMPTIRFNLGRFMTLSAAVRKDRPVSTIVVFKAMSLNDSAAARFIFDANDLAAQNYRHFAYHIENNGGFSGGIGEALPGGTDNPATEDLEVHVMMQKVYLDTCEVYVDNILVSRVLGGANSVDWLTLGADFGGNRGFDGSICQLEAYEGVPAFMDDRAAELLDKWREQPRLVITAHPLNQTILDQDTASLTVTATDADSYQWYYALVSNGVWLVSAGDTNPAFTSPAIDVSLTGIKFRCEVTNTRGTVVSDESTVTVVASDIAPTIITQPLDATVTDGEKGNLFVEALGAVSYQWWYLLNGQGNWLLHNNFSSPTAVTHTLFVANTGTRYRCTVTNTYGETLTREAIMTVVIPPVKKT